MTTPHRTLQMALDALDAITDDVDGTGLNTMPSFDKALDAIAALREALAADHLRDVAEKVAPAAPVPDALVEAVAKAIYWEWRRDAGYVPWVDGGNSLKQDDARKIARAVVSSAAPVPDGWVMVPMEPTPEMIAAMPYPANTIPAVGVACYRAMIAAAPAAPVAPNGCERIFTHKWLDPDCIEQGCKSLAAPVVPLTDEQIWSMWMSSEFRGNGGQVDWFCEGIRAAEAHHGITGGKP